PPGRDHERDHRGSQRRGNRLVVTPIYLLVIGFATGVEYEQPKKARTSSFWLQDFVSGRKDAMGMFLGLGGILYLIGWIWLVVIAFRTEGILWGLIVLIFGWL